MSTLRRLEQSEVVKMKQFEKPLFMTKLFVEKGHDQDLKGRIECRKIATEKLKKGRVERKAEDFIFLTCVQPFTIICGDAINVPAGSYYIFTRLMTYMRIEIEAEEFVTVDYYYFEKEFEYLIYEFCDVDCICEKIGKQIMVHSLGLVAFQGNNYRIFQDKVVVEGRSQTRYQTRDTNETRIVFSSSSERLTELKNDVNLNSYVESQSMIECLFTGTPTFSIFVKTTVLQQVINYCTVNFNHIHIANIMVVQEEVFDQNIRNIQEMEAETMLNKKIEQINRLVDQGYLEF